MRTFIYFVEDTETSFVLNDLKQIASKYERVILLSSESVDNRIEFPDNVMVFDNFINWKNLNIKAILLNNFFSIFFIYFKECIALKKLLPLKQSIALLCSNFYKASESKRALDTLKGLDFASSPFYAFWFYDCIYLARLKQLGIAKNVYVRAHGGDLFEDRSSLSGKVLYRHYQLKYINRVFSVSEAGANYLKGKYPAFAGKISTLYLGSFYHDFLNPLIEDHFTIVSCAKIRDVKRIHLIAEALQSIDFNCTWYHIGDENLSAENDESIPMYLNAKQALKLKSNIVFKPLGALSNSEVYEFYKETPVNLFISVSASEGIPVSMMEAISFGIPVISSNVGGCNEIVNDNSGVLIPADSIPETIAHCIEEFRKSNKNTIIFRKTVKEFWKNTFDANANYDVFFKS
jgi:glycosyltransferase involved in cell wall biosynthesis